MVSDGTDKYPGDVTLIMKDDTSGCEVYNVPTVVNRMVVFGFKTFSTRVVYSRGWGIQRQGDIQPASNTVPTSEPNYSNFVEVRPKNWIEIVTFGRDCRKDEDGVLSAD